MKLKIGLLTILILSLVICVCGDPTKKVIDIGVVDRVEPFALWYVVHFTDGNAYQFGGDHNFKRGDSVEVYQMSNEFFQEVRKIQ